MASHITPGELAEMDRTLAEVAATLDGLVVAGRESLADEDPTQVTAGIIRALTTSCCMHHVAAVCAVAVVRLARQEAVR